MASAKDWRLAHAQPLRTARVSEQRSEDVRDMGLEQIWARSHHRSPCKKMGQHSQASGGTWSNFESDQLPVQREGVGLIPNEVSDLAPGFRRKRREKKKRERIKSRGPGERPRKRPNQRYIQILLALPLIFGFIMILNGNLLSIIILSQAPWINVLNPSCLLYSFRKIFQHALLKAKLEFIL